MSPAPAIDKKSKEARLGFHALAPLLAQFLREPPLPGTIFVSGAFTHIH
jgi:hypothetical protein